MTSFTHTLSECKKCGCHHCKGCDGEFCRACSLEEYAEALESNLDAIREIIKPTYDEKNIFGCFKKIVEVLDNE